MNSFLFSPLCHYMLISRVDNAVGALMPRSLSQGCCWPLPMSRVYESFGPVPPGRQSNPASALGRNKRKKTQSNLL